MKDTFLPVAFDKANNLREGSQGFEKYYQIERCPIIAEDILVGMSTVLVNSVTGICGRTDVAG